MLRKTRDGRRKPFQPNKEEIEAGIAGVLDISFRLGPKGGERWARHAGVDWSRWGGDIWSSQKVGQITTASREFTEFLFERERRTSKVQSAGIWSEVRPWKATYWHEEPVGYQVRFRVIANEEECEFQYPFHWNFTSFGMNRRPVDLSPRRERKPAPDVQHLSSLTDWALDRRLWQRSALTRLAAVNEWIRRPDSTIRLIQLLNHPYPEVRLTATIEIGRCKAKEATPALLDALFRFGNKKVAMSLGQIGDRRSMQPLFQVFAWCGQYSDCGFSASVASAILQFGDRAIDRLERLANKSDHHKRHFFGALRQSSSARAIRILLRSWPEDSYTLSQMPNEARVHLFRIASDATETHARRLTTARALAESKGDLHEEGRLIEQELDDGPNIKTAQVACIVHGNGFAQVDDPVEALIGALKYPSWEKRVQAIDELGRLNARGASKAIAELCSDERWEVRACVARTLAGWGEQAESLSRLREDSDILVRGLARWTRLADQGI